MFFSFPLTSSKFVKNSLNNNAFQKTNILEQSIIDKLSTTLCVWHILFHLYVYFNKYIFIKLSTKSSCFHLFSCSSRVVWSLNTSLGEFINRYVWDRLVWKYKTKTLNLHYLNNLILINQIRAWLWIYNDSKILVPNQEPKIGGIYLIMCHVLS